MTINLFWTGGWDSTFRLMQVVFDLATSAQPIYVVDEGRRSTRMELHTIAAIKQAVRKKDSAAGARILPTRISSRSDISEQPAITEAIARLRKRIHIGDQYDWLARYADVYESGPVEMAIHHGGEIYEALKRSADRDELGRYVVRSDAEDMYTIFKYFRFPLLDMTKDEMHEEVMSKGRQEIQELAWFCHLPRENETPCGSCSACRQVLKGGMGYRIPFPQRVEGRIKLITVHSRLGRSVATAWKNSAKKLRK